MALLAGALVRLDVLKLDAVDSIRVRRPGVIHRLHLGVTPVVDMTTGYARHITALPRAAAALADHAALRRALKKLDIHACCLDTVGRAAPSIAAFTALTSLQFRVHAHRKRDPGRLATALAPLSALVNLADLKCEYMADFVACSLRQHGMYLGEWPALPNAPNLTRLALKSGTNFVPVGSPAALGRLRRLDFWKSIVTRTEAKDDPLFLRAAFDAGTWQPDHMTSLREVFVEFNHIEIKSPFQAPQPTRSRPGAEWAPLAGRVTGLTVIAPPVPARTATGIVAGLGVLASGLRSLHAWKPDYSVGARAPDPDTIALGGFTRPTIMPGAPPVDLDRLQLGALTRLVLTNTPFPRDSAACPGLAVVKAITGIPQKQPVDLHPFVGRPRLRTLWLEGAPDGLLVINLAQLFAGGAPLLALTTLVIKEALVEWDETGLPIGTPTAAQFVARRHELLPALARFGLLVTPSAARIGASLFTRQGARVQTFIMEVIPRLLEGVEDIRRRSTAGRWWKCDDVWGERGFGAERFGASVFLLQLLAASAWGVVFANKKKCVRGREGENALK